MRWNIVNTNRRRWHRWFAWYPIPIEDKWVWFEIVERCWMRAMRTHPFKWHYRSVDSNCTYHSSDEVKRKT